MRSSGEIVYVALGANLGDRDATFTAAIRTIESESELLLLAASPVFETEPFGPAGQGAYLNAVVKLRVWLGPAELLRRLQLIETALGRDRRRESQRWGSREIDLDILFFGERCVESPDLVVPHVRAHRRIFVMAPMAEIAPSFVHPKLGITMEEIARSFSDRDGVQAWPRPAGWPGSRVDASSHDSDPRISPRRTLFNTLSNR
jgi:2-amino-4-hydroxy-6-hydroxymethyldihydropteridine diphosphokinase